MTNLNASWSANAPPQRNRYDPSQTHSRLLSTLSHRISHALHLPIPALSADAYASASSPPFYLLPLPAFTTRLGQPVAVISLRGVVRDETGSLGELKGWTWCALEMVRRTLRDWWGSSADADADADAGAGDGADAFDDVCNCAGCAGRDIEAIEGFLRNWLLDAGERNWD